MTANQLFEMADDGNRRELVRGVLHMISPAGSDHGRIASRILIRLGLHVQKNELGETYAAETGFLISVNPDTVRAPDASFVSRARIESLDAGGGYLPLAPDLVVEVVSPSDTSSHVEAKAAEWILAGSRAVLVADPANETIRVYRDTSNVQVLRSGDVFVASDACPDWTLKVDDAFGPGPTGI